MDLVESIRGAQRRILELQREIQLLENQLVAAKKLLEQEIGPNAHRTAARTRPIRPRSTVWWARQALKHAGKPLHIDELVRRVREFSGQSVNKPTLVGNLSRYVRMGDTFVRVEDGVYGLAPTEQEARR